MNADILDDPQATPPLNELPPDTDRLDRSSLTKYARRGFTIDCNHTRP